MTRAIAAVMKGASAAALLMTTLALAARAQTPAAPSAPGAAPDSSLHRFLESLADSTDQYFGLAAEPADTTGLDSTLAVRLTQPPLMPRTGRSHWYRPDFAFNRVDGNRWGASAWFGSRRQRWRVSGDLGCAAGSNTWLGGAEAQIGMRRRDTFYRLRVGGGRRTAVMDRDLDEGALATARALMTGSDRQQYLRRDGFRIAASGNGPGWVAGIAYRDWLESPLAVTTRWNLARRALASPDNLQATPGRTRELALEAGLRWPGIPVRSQVVYQLSDRALGSDFDYRRTRVALGGELPLLGHVSLLPQLVYGRLSGNPIPQAGFYLGGWRALRSLPVGAAAGTGLALARLDLLAADDLLALARIPHPAPFPLQGALFVASGAVWGPDPFGGSGSARGGWPEQNAWRSEAGLSLLYRPGVPDEDAYLRVNLAWPVGPVREGSRWSISYSRALDLLWDF